MPFRIELKLSFSGNDWSAENNEIKVSASSLPELDKKIGNILRISNLYEKDKLVQVYMFFDQETIPEWIRQYSNHYMNRMLEVKI